ncbi:MAG: FeoB-associated Cys-rich membrane protein [Candidatus Hydrogenedentes bacterium]|nr:FeoB-associated Cys-rich membrane protein [Candidatus Hydrogenedentota bacterium]
MAQTVIAVAVVAGCAAFLIRRWWRVWSGKAGACGGCGTCHAAAKSAIEGAASTPALDERGQPER